MKELSQGSIYETRDKILYKINSIEDLDGKIVIYNPLRSPELELTLPLKLFLWQFKFIGRDSSSEV